MSKDPRLRAEDMFKKPDEADKTSKNELEAARRAAAAAKTAKLRALRLARDAAEVEATGAAAKARTKPKYTRHRGGEAPYSAPDSGGDGP